MVTLIGTEVGMALPTTALFDYPSAEALAYFIASAQVCSCAKKVPRLGSTSYHY